MLWHCWPIPQAEHATPYCGALLTQLGNRHTTHVHCVTAQEDSSDSQSQPAPSEPMHTLTRDHTPALARGQKRVTAGGNSTIQDPCILALHMCSSDTLTARRRGTPYSLAAPFTTHCRFPVSSLCIHLIDIVLHQTEVG